MGTPVYIGRQHVWFGPLSQTFASSIGIAVSVAVLPVSDTNYLFCQPVFFREAFSFWGTFNAHTCGGLILAGLLIGHQDFFIRKGTGSSGCCDCLYCHKAIFSRVNSFEECYI